MTARRVHLVVPEGYDDPGRPSGGNAFDQRVRDGLGTWGWDVRMHPVRGAWPRPSRDDLVALGTTLAGLPDSATVVADGLVMSAAPRQAVEASRRVVLVVLVHLPLGVSGDPESRDAERTALRAASGVVATSGWTATWLREHDAVSGLVGVVEPGTDPAPLTDPSPDGGRLLCVGALSPVKGQDLLVEALRDVAALRWTCQVVGSPEVDPGFARNVADRARKTCGGRVLFTGVAAGDALRSSYAAADLLVLPSRVETYGMVVTEALARGVPVVAAQVGGVAATLGRAASGTRPGVLVPREDVPALANALRRWLVDPALRARLRAAAVERRAALTGWDVTFARLSRILERMGESG